MGEGGKERMGCGMQIFTQELPPPVNQEQIDFFTYMDTEVALRRICNKKFLLLASHLCSFLLEGIGLECKQQCFMLVSPNC